jgi:hypothetical protein
MQKEVSTFRLNLMRSLYLLICVGLGSEIWPLMFHHKPWDLMHGVACSLPDGNCVMSHRHSLALCSGKLREEAWR